MEKGRIRISHSVCPLGYGLSDPVFASLQRQYISPLTDRTGSGDQLNSWFIVYLGPFWWRQNWRLTPVVQMSPSRVAERLT